MIKVVSNFITLEEEKIILSHIKPTNYNLGVARNNIIRYGSSVPYKGMVVGPIPLWMEKFCLRVMDNGFSAFIPDSVTINEYHKGQAIDWHIDSPSSGPVINVLSLSTKALMGLKKDDEEELHILQPRSLLHLEGEHRTDWKHCIFPVEHSRFSIVFRKGTTLIT